MNLSQRLRLVSLDKKQWQRLYYKNQQAYIRQRLSAIRYLSEGKSRAEVAQLLLPSRQKNIDLITTQLLIQRSIVEPQRLKGHRQ